MVTDLNATLEEMLRAIKRLDVPIQPGSPRRHHFIPQFFLRQFAGQQKRLIPIALPNQNRQATKKATHVKNLAVVKDFYTAETQVGQSAVAESFLGEWDGVAATLFREILTPDAWPLSAEKKAKLSIWIALLLTRSPRIRRQYEAMAETVVQFASRLGDDSASEQLSEIHQNRHIAFMFSSVEQMVEPIHRRHWTLVKFNADGLVLPDVSLIKLGGPPNPQFGVGLDTAAELILPIGRRHLLSMRTYAGLTSDYVDIPAEASKYLIPHFNNPLISGAYREAFCHPGDYDRVAPIAEKYRSAPVLAVDGDGIRDLQVDGVNQQPIRPFPKRHRPRAS